MYTDLAPPMAKKDTAPNFRPPYQPGARARDVTAPRMKQTGGLPVEPICNTVRTGLSGGIDVRGRLMAGSPQLIYSYISSEYCI